MIAERYYLPRGLAARIHARLPQPQGSASTQPPRAIALAGTRGRGFTFIELLVVIAMLAILAALLVPSLARAGANTAAIQCMNNLRQLTLGWFMYSGNSGNKLVSSQNWDTVSMVSSQSTNWMKIQQTDLLYPYVKDVRCWHCPADISTVKETTGQIYAWGGPGNLRVRSVSMNAWVGGPSLIYNGMIGVLYSNLSGISNPANTILLVDENPGTINDALWYSPLPEALWSDIPASYHNNGGGVSYADGHSEIHVWQDPAILGHLVNVDSGNASNIQPLDGGQDLNWVQHHVTQIPAAFGSGF